MSLQKIVVCVCLLISSVPASADPAPVASACKKATGPITVAFSSKVGLKDLVAWAHSFTCKTILYAANMDDEAHQVSIVSGESMSVDEAYRVFTAALTEMYLMAVPDGDLVQIQHLQSGSQPSDVSIKKIDDTHYDVPRSLANPALDDGSARIVPSIKDGKPDGFKIYAIKPDSLPAKLGLQNGDTIEAINGIALTSADKALELYSKLADSSLWALSVRRKGNVMTLYYTIR